MKQTSSVPTIIVSPTTVEEIQELVVNAPKVLSHGAQTKAPLLADSESQELVRIDMTRFSGIIEYEPAEYTFTAHAGTPLATIAATLAEHGQYMPFDPPLIQRGATLGGTIAAGLSGSGRFRFGGIRDFILGVHFIDGQGRLVRGGGKVVKNAAGFDLPKLMVGSIGRLGILTSATFKVFPAPHATATLTVKYDSLTDALKAMTRLMGGPYDLEALDLAPSLEGTVHLLARVGGPADVVASRVERLRLLLNGGEALLDDIRLWQDTSEFSWADDAGLLVKTSTNAQALPALDDALQSAGAKRRYTTGGNLVWISWPTSLEACDKILRQNGLSGLVIAGGAKRAVIGKSINNIFLKRIRAALDPSSRFLEYE